ncbi:MAG TPA: hypothetical protein VE377_17760 [Candidatus Dormibacteraeota bacterium]|nr:hypothetical protein [Candidatus Dormibacteraeota bacterium]
MKLLKLGLFFALVVAVSVPVVAQTQLKLDIPFNFVVDGKTLPAGQYRVAQVYGDSHVWSIANNHNSAFIHTNTVQSPLIAHRASLIFWHSGGEYTLARFWPEEHVGDELFLAPRVKSTMLAKSGEYVELGAE